MWLGSLCGTFVNHTRAGGGRVGRGGVARLAARFVDELRGAAGSLAARGIDYEYVFALGGRRRAAPDPAQRRLANEQFRLYADHMQTPELEGALRRLLEEERRAALTCAEAQWWRCHRRLPADARLRTAPRCLHADARGRSRRAS